MWMRMRLNIRLDSDNQRPLTHRTDDEGWNVGQAGIVWLLGKESLETLACSMYNFQIRALSSGPWNVTRRIFGSRGTSAMEMKSTTARLPSI
jgi:hypothetical protein